MKVEIREVFVPAPPKEVVITLSEKEAAMLNRIVGNIEGGVNRTGTKSWEIRQFTNHLYHKLRMTDTREYKDCSEAIKNAMNLVDD